MPTARSNIHHSNLSMPCAIGNVFRFLDNGEYARFSSIWFQLVE